MKKPLATLLLCLFANLGHADDGSLEPAVADIAHRWARINYQTPAREQEKAFGELAGEAGRLAAEAPGKPQPMVWQAITLASYAKARGGLGALSAVKQARELLLGAEKLDPQTLNGSIYTSLGSLYAKVPGWPVGFGDKKQAARYLETALRMNPRGIDAHYFYADYLAEQGDYAAAVEHLQMALQAPPRAGREDADAGRRKDVQALLEEIRHHHAEKLAAR